MAFPLDHCRSVLLLVTGFLCMCAEAGHNCHSPEPHQVSPEEEQQYCRFNQPLNILTPSRCAVTEVLLMGDDIIQLVTHSNITSITERTVTKMALVKRDRVFGPEQCELTYTEYEVHLQNHCIFKNELGVDIGFDMYTRSECPEYSSLTAGSQVILVADGVRQKEGTNYVSIRHLFQATDELLDLTTNVCSMSDTHVPAGAPASSSCPARQEGADCVAECEPEPEEVTEAVVVENSTPLILETSPPASYPTTTFIYDSPKDMRPDSQQSDSSSYSSANILASSYCIYALSLICLKFVFVR